MAVMRVAQIAVLAGLALAVSGCGGDKRSADLPAGAELAPASAPVYIDIATDPNGAQWQAVDRLLKRFPGREKLLAELQKELTKEGVDWERDVKPALPEELHVVWFDFENGGEDVVGYAKPKDKAKFVELLESGNDPLAHTEIDGWTVFSDKQKVLDRFQQARASGESLSDVKSFRDGTEDLPADAVVRGWIGGKAIYDMLEREAADDPDLLKLFRDFTESFGELEHLTFSAGAEQEGVRLEAGYKTDKEQEIGEFSPELDDVLPANALAYVSFGNLEDYLNTLVESADESFPEFQRERSKIEKALGFSLKSDLFPLFSNEGAIAVYRGGELDFPILLFVLSVDEEKATHVIERLAALAELSGDAESRTVQVGGLEATEVRFPSGVSIFALVDDGKAYVASDRSVLEQALNGSKLADDPAYQDARRAAEVPDETVGFVYVDLADGLPYIIDFVETTEPGSVSPEVRANTEPLESVFMFAAKDGERVTLSGFLTIK
jgi:hypothetical protein